MNGPRTIERLTTPALLLDASMFDSNIRAMSEHLPDDRLRPHVKAHKCSEIARMQQVEGRHDRFTCATVREVEVLAAQGIGTDLLLANEVVGEAASRLGRISDAHGVRVTAAVDSEATVYAAADGGVRDVLVDVNVGLPRCGCDPEDAGRIADLARSNGLNVRGVMGYEGHVVGLPEREERVAKVAEAMELLVRAAELVGADEGIVSAGGTGTYDINPWATEIQAGSYVLMDTHYDKLNLPFGHALFVLATVISVAPNGKYAVADCGLKALGMDHGNPTIKGARVWFCSDEHVTFAPAEPVRVGDRLRVLPAHIDPTMAYHSEVHVITHTDQIIETWPIDMRGW
ncbi:MAG TPA: alanine racemase [Acidimicrobiales bacterium]